SAFLQSIIATPVISRSSLTAAAVIADISNFYKFFKLKGNGNLTGGSQIRYSLIQEASGFSAGSSS
ncbi:MAG: hypothetical protein QF457_08380, partial [SAR324 cluster bacterium]|nr:hypothetical protein [SAR324 cluster bacterium]